MAQTYQRPGVASCGYSNSNPGPLSPHYSISGAVSYGAIEAPEATPREMLAQAADDLRRGLNHIDQAIGSLDEAGYTDDAKKWQRIVSACDTLEAICKELEAGR